MLGTRQKLLRFMDWAKSTHRTDVPAASSQPPAPYQVSTVGVTASSTVRRQYMFETRQKLLRLMDWAKSARRTDIPASSSQPPAQHRVNTIGMTASSTVHRQVLQKLSEVALTDDALLITGPTKIRKQLYAKYVHLQSSRSRAAFVPVNCGTVPHSFLEDLFGNAGGTLAGAQPRTEGLIAAAEGGTLFLDKIDTLSLSLQVKLLRFLQGKEYRRLGEARKRATNVRLIAAANTDLVNSVQSGRFREDLYSQLHVIPSNFV
jgi:transcriptional regulator with GAF, ATPase, and Fis domain